MATISAPNTKNVITWKIELTFSAKSWKRSGISCSNSAECDARDERGDQAVAEGQVGKPVRGDAQADRVDPLIAAGDPTRWSRPMDAPADDPENDAQHRPECGLAEQLDALCPRRRRVWPARGRTARREARGRRSARIRGSRVWRTRLGTRWAVTADVTTGSVGVSTAASRNASAQPSSPNRAAAIRARSSVSGIAKTIARAGGPQCIARSSRSTIRPSANSVRINASSTRWNRSGSSGLTSTTSASPRTLPGRPRARDREHRPPHHAREHGRDSQQQAKDQQRLGEPEVHGDRLCAGHRGGYANAETGSRRRKIALDE